MSDQALSHPAPTVSPATPSTARHWRTEDWSAVVRAWRLVETLNWECYVRDGDELSTSGLFVELDAWRYHFLRFE